MGAIFFRMGLFPHVSFPFSSGTGGPVGAGFSPPLLFPNKYRLTNRIVSSPPTSSH